jgi:DNA polymerase-1
MRGQEGTRVTERKRKLCLVDGNSYIHRAYHAIRGLTNRRGLPTNAVYGFLNMLLKVVNEERPDMVAVVFDAPGPTFRHEIYREYKANRPRMPEDLAVQVDYIKRLTAAFGITALEMPGYEADDLLATLGRRAAEKGHEVLFITGDKDIQQLLDDGLSALDTMRERLITRDSFIEEHGLEPSQLVEVMALAGDSTDNIPGVPGIGPKTAEKLVKDHGSLQDLYDSLEKLPQGRLKESLSMNREQAFMSRRLVILKDDLDVEVDWGKLSDPQPDKKTLKALFEELDFRKFMREMDLDDQEDSPGFEAITDTGELEAWSSDLKGEGTVAVALTTNASSAEKDFLCVALSSDGVRAAVFTLGYEAAVSAGGELLREILENTSLIKDSFDFKSVIYRLQGRGVDLQGLGLDVLIAAYLTDPSIGAATLGDLAVTFLDDSSLWPGEGNSNKERDRALFADEHRLQQQAAREAAAVWRLGQKLTGELRKTGMMDLYSNLELPLIRILSGMEMEGIGVDTSRLLEMSKEMETLLQGMEEEIYRLAGGPFNINSPKQLSTVLFEKLKLTPVKKTKTGFSTNEEVLTILAAGHELPSRILGYRQLTKLKNTYVDVLPKLVSTEDGRLHTTFNQTVTATGRLSSKNPNLQNIPVRSEWGRRIRRAFVPREGWSFVSADYSQIELRLLAHLSGDETLVQAFRNGEDIHNRTAMEIFGVDSGGVTGEMRREAKVINFGIIYGMGPYGLSRELGVSQEEAGDYIDGYFRVYHGVRRYLDEVIEGARKEGYVSTLFGRRRYLREFESDKPQVVQFAERAAVNTPVQGTAADLIKMAMIAVSQKLSEDGFKARLLVQIHDELLLEAPPEEVSQTAVMVRECMVGVAGFDVPIVVDLKTGPNWADLEPWEGSD